MIDYRDGLRACLFTLNGAVQAGSESMGTVTLNGMNVPYNFGAVDMLINEVYAYDTFNTGSGMLTMSLIVTSGNQRISWDKLPTTPQVNLLRKQFNEIAAWLTQGLTLTKVHTLLGRRGVDYTRLGGGSVQRGGS